METHNAENANRSVENTFTQYFKSKKCGGQRKGKNPEYKTKQTTEEK